MQCPMHFFNQVHKLDFMFFIRLLFGTSSFLFPFLANTLICMKNNNNNNNDLTLPFIASNLSKRSRAIERSSGLPNSCKSMAEFNSA